MATATTNIDRLLPFCDGGASQRYALATPWFADGIAFASDGRIAAWMPSEPFEIPCEGKRPNAWGIINQNMPTSLQWEPMPPLPEVTPCPKCNDAGFVIEERCTTCNGKGKVEHDCGCEYCLENYEECPDCEGDGKFDGEDAKVSCTCLTSDNAHVIAGGKFSLRRLRNIAALGDGVVISREQCRLAFKCGEILGVLVGEE
jgi:hypothetical protein